MILWRFFFKFEHFTKQGKNDFLKNVSIKNPSYSKCYANSNAKKTFFISTIICKSNGNGNGNDYLYICLLQPRTVRNGVGTVRKKLVTRTARNGTVPVTERERYRYEMNYCNITVQLSKIQNGLGFLKMDQIYRSFIKATIVVTKSYKQ